VKGLTLTDDELASLTQDEAAERAALLTVTRYDVVLDFTGLADGDRLTSTSTISFDCTTPGSSTFLDTALVVERATLNGTPLDPVSVTHGRLPLPALESTNTLVVTGHQDDTGSSAGVLKSVDAADGRVYVWTSFEPDEARKVFACFDQPDLKAVFGFTARVPDTWTALSNTSAVSTTERADTRTVVFADTPPLSPYVVVVNAGPFHEVRRRAGGYDLGLYCRQSLIPALEAGAEEIFAFTEHGLAWYGERFGMPFPQERYDQIFVPNMGGAMENWGAVTHTDLLLFRSEPSQGERAERGEFILHEMAHMWFGDLVTMRWWDDLWLNEAFASWASNWALAAVPGYEDTWANFNVGGKQSAYRQDLSPATHPIRGVVPDVDQATANFDNITYEKGLSVLRQLHAYIGEEAFLTGLQHYFRDHAWSNTVLTDLMDAFGAAAGLDLSSWTDAWLDHAGTDVITLDQATLTLTSPDQAAPRSHRLDIASYAADGSLLATTPVTTSGTSAQVSLPDAAVHLLNAGDLTFASVRSDPRSEAWLRENAGRLPDVMSRALAVTSAYDALLRGAANGADFLRTALSVLRTERAPAVVESVLSRATSVAERWTATSLVADQRAALAAVALELADDPANELAALRVLAANALAEEHWTRLEEPAAASTDLSWRILIRKAELGEYDEAVTAALAARDPDPDAWANALAVKAAVADATAKEEVWQAVMVDNKVPLTDGFWLLTNAFWRPGQESLLRPYAERYLEAVAPLTGSMLAAGPRIGRMYPDLVGDDDFLAAAQAVASDQSVAAMVRQLLTQANDTLRRELTARRN